jgi:tetratricopeptide (TPR) repeat protein
LGVSAGSRGGTAGLSLAKVRPWDYAVSQFGVILHYLRLSFWPSGLCLDYGWPVARRAGEILPGAAVTGLLFAATVWALASLRKAGRDKQGLVVLSGRSRWAAWGFLGGWFFVILAPTSSFMPLADLAFEHRMYLPLAAVTTGATIAAYLLAAGAIRRLGPARAGRRAAWGMAFVGAAASAAGLGWGTFLRNADYRTGLSIYEDAARKCPNNARAHSNLGYVLIDAGEIDRALAACSRAIELSPDFAEAYNNRGLAFAAKGQYDRAIADYNRVIELQPDHAEAHNNRGAAFAEMGRYDQAIADYTRAIKVKPDYADAYANLGAARHKAGSVEQAVIDYTRAIQLKPNSVGAHNNRGYAYADLGRFREAMADFDKALQLDPNDANTYDSRASAYLRMRQYDKAWEDVRTCRRLGGKPDPKMVEDLVRASGRED